MREALSTATSSLTTSCSPLETGSRCISRLRTLAWREGICSHRTVARSVVHQGRSVPSHNWVCLKYLHLHTIHTTHTTHVFSAMLGSTLDTWCCQSSWPFHRCSSWTRLFCLDPEVPHNGGSAVAVPLQGRQHPCRCAETASHGLTSETIEILLLQYIDKWLMLVVQVRQVLASMLDTVVHMPVVVQRQVPWLVETVQNLWEFRSLHCLLDRLMACLLACRLFRAVYTGTRPGLSPAIRAGKGWRGQRELAPRCSATQ